MGLIQLAAPENRDQLLELTAATGVFKPLEIETLGEVLDDYFSINHQHQHQSNAYWHEDQIIGFNYYAPAAMTDRTWYLYWIAVDPKFQKLGIGRSLMLQAEYQIAQLDGRILFIETSSLPGYDATRSFYLRMGYECTGILKDYYCDGDDMVVFRKRLRKLTQKPV